MSPAAGTEWNNVANGFDDVVCLGDSCLYLHAPGVGKQVRRGGSSADAGRLVWGCAQPRSALLRLFLSNAVFLGTDPGERWTLKDFQDKYKKPSWDYTAKERHVFLSPDHRLAWFDEALQRKPDFGEMRATGVLVKSSEGKWKIAQYNLTFLVQNSIFPKMEKGQNCRPKWAMRCEK